MKKNNRTLPASVIRDMSKNYDKHKMCFERLIDRIEKEGFHSLLVHPDFQEEHNKNGKFLVYVENTDLFYSTNEPSLYIRKCINEGIKPENICAIKENGEYQILTL